VRNLGSNALHALGHNGPQRGFIRQVSMSFSYFGFTYSYRHWKSVRNIFLVSFTASFYGTMDQGDIRVSEEQELSIMLGFQSQSSRHLHVCK
jgi:hypothetical protein